MSVRERLIYTAAAVLAIAGTLVIGVVDIHTSEVVVTMALVFVLSMVLGAIAPRGGWYWAVLSMIGVPVVNLFPRMARMPPNPHLPRTFWSYLLLITLLMLGTFPGMLFGVVVRRAMHVAKQVDPQEP